jgi:septum formation protein
MPTPPVLCLASASPRRRELLTQIGVPHRVVPSAIDETALPLEPPHDYVLRVARAKAEAVAGSAAARGLPVLAADTSVVAGGRVFAKPAGPEEARAMLETLSGATHVVLSAVVLAAGGTLRSRIAESQVRFRPIGAEELHAYCATREPYDKAGGYAIQGLAAVFVAEIRGSYSGVMGLPLCETAELLRDAGIPYWTNIGP